MASGNISELDMMERFKLLNKLSDLLAKGCSIKPENDAYKKCGAVFSEGLKQISEALEVSANKKLDVSEAADAPVTLGRSSLY